MVIDARWANAMMIIMFFMVINARRANAMMIGAMFYGR